MTTDPDQPYRRPQPGMERVGEEASSADGGTSTALPVGNDPVILDPRFHQSVWMPWQDPAEASPMDSDHHGSPSSRAGRGLLLFRTIRCGC